MYTFSCLQRNSDDEKTFIKYLATFLSLFLYAIISTIYLFFPPLFGLSIWHIATAKNRAIQMIWFLYLYIYEIDHGLVCCTVIAAALASIFFYRRLSHIIVCYACLKIIVTSFFYITFAVIFVFVSYILHMQIDADFMLIVYYLILDMVLVLYAK